jgi:hypothetical protein
VTDVVALVEVAAATRVDLAPPPAKSLAPDATEVEKHIAGAEHDATEGPRVVEPAHEIPPGEPIVPPSPVSTFLPKARLITAGEVAGTRQQKPSVEETSVVGTSSGGILVTPLKSRYAVSTQLVDDQMLTSNVLKHFQDTFKELYKFSTVCLLVFVVTFFDEYLDFLTSNLSCCADNGQSI